MPIIGRSLPYEQEETEEGKLVGKKIEVNWSEKLGTPEVFAGVIVAFDPFDGTVSVLHV